MAAGGDRAHDRCLHGRTDAMASATPAYSSVASAGGAGVAGRGHLLSTGRAVGGRLNPPARVPSTPVHAAPTGTLDGTGVLTRDVGRGRVTTGSD